MKQHHRAVVGSGQKLGESCLLGGLGVVVPVHIGKAPEQGLISQFLGHFQVFLAVNSLGRPVEFGKLLADGFLVKRFQVGQLLGKGRLVRKPAHVVVVHGVVAHGVPLGDHPPHQIRALPDVISHQEEGGGNLLLLQGVQNFGGAAVFVSGVKGQIQHLFVGVADIRRLILAQLILPGVADGRRALLTEAQSPGAGAQGAGSKHADAHRQGNDNGDEQNQQIPFFHTIPPEDRVCAAGGNMPLPLCSRVWYNEKSRRWT